MRNLLGVTRSLLPSRQPVSGVPDRDELRRDREAFDRIQMALQQQRFPYALSVSPVEVQPVRGCFDQTRRFIVGLMSTASDAPSAPLCVDVKPPPRTVHAMRSLLAYGPTLLFGEGLQRRGSGYFGPHAVAVLALLPGEESGEGPQLLLYDGDDTGSDARGRALRDVARNVRLELHEVLPQTWHDAGLTHAFFRLEPADALMAAYRPTWRDHLVLPDDAPDSDGWGACLQYLHGESAEAFRNDPDLPLPMAARRLVESGTRE